jgi:predicted alpha/beta superfamily hydrolase
MILLRKKYLAFCLFLVFLLSTNFAYSQLDSLPKHNNKAFLIHSKILNESRSIWVHLPSGYNSITKTYPVLYLLDGEGNFNYVSELVDYLAAYDRNRIPELIVIGIHNVDRIRDFTPIQSLLSLNGKMDSVKMAEVDGGLRFLQFIKNELVPYIDQNYRTQPYRILAAHSLGGLFGLYAMGKSPQLFQSTILMSPAINEGNSQLLNDFASFLKEHPNLKGKLFMSLGNENMQAINPIVRQLKTTAPKSFDWIFRPYEDDDHFSVTYKSMFDGLKFIYKNWYVSNYSDIKMTYKDIKLHFTKLSDEFGYVIKPTEDFVNNCGYKQLQSGNTDMAIEIFKQNIENYPNSFNVYDSMGEAFIAKGEKKLAIENYEKSISLNPNNEDGKKILKQLKNLQ